jgi:hypothetical protein
MGPLVSPPTAYTAPEEVLVMPEIPTSAGIEIVVHASPDISCKTPEFPPAIRVPSSDTASALYN